VINPSSPEKEIVKFSKSFPIKEVENFMYRGMKMFIAYLSNNKVEENQINSLKKKHPKQSNKVSLKFKTIIAHNIIEDNDEE
jgi:hypothetical protein